MTNETLLEILDIEPLERNLFRARQSPPGGWARVFGGRVIAQALRAAILTVEGRQPHSLHGYFLLGGDPTIPILFDVERIRDGRSFTTRRVVAIQRGEAIFSMSASFHVEEPGYAHQAAMPEVPKPEDLPDADELRRRYLDKISPNRQAYWQRERPIEMRPTDPDAYFLRKPGGGDQSLWFRCKGPLPDDQGLHACILAYVSDMTLLDGAMVPHGKSVVDPDVQSASLDHALWFHEPFRTDQWLLYSQDSPWSGHARGFSRGMIHGQDGRLIASVVQEGMIRPRRIDPPKK